MKSSRKIFAQACACAIALAGAASSAQAANWIMLQGTEAPSVAPTTQVWGFLQPQYSYTDGTPLTAGTPWGGQKAVFNTIAPDQDSSSQFHIQRARLGARGQNFPLNSKVNYFFLAEFGNNGITAGQNGSAMINDASVTFSYIPGARIRAGLFKTPGAEEGLQAIHVFDYINFTSVTDALLLERFFDRDGAPACTVAAGGTADTCANRPNGPVAAFRDVGVQVFDAFTTGNWEHTYAAMVGNGNGINRGDNNDNKDYYAYFSTERVFAGEGPRREGLKFFVWHQTGKRDLITGGTGTQATGSTVQKFDRKRTGGGLTFRKAQYRATAEYVTADGMIFEGTDGGAVAGAANNAGTAFATFNMTGAGEANGYYVDFGFLVTPKIELDVRYDVLNRRTDNAAAERQYTTSTLGAQYFFDRKTRVTLNYELREAEAPNLPSTDVANRVLDAMDDRITLQVTSLF